MNSVATNTVRVAALAVSVLLCNGAAAAEAADALAGNAARLAGITSLSSTLLGESEALAMLREGARKSQAGRDEAKSPVRRLAIKSTATPAMIEKMMELEALPFVKVSGKSRHRVYFGISFDGVLGIHGNF